MVTSDASGYLLNMFIYYRCFRRHDEIQRMFQLGYNYAHKLHEEGRFDKFQLQEVLLTETGHVQEVMTRI